MTIVNNLYGALREVESKYKSQLKIVHVNAQSLLCLAHATEFQHLFNNAKVDIIAVSETFYRDSNDYVSLDGYDLFAANRSTYEGGGVAIYVRRPLICKILCQSEPPLHRVSKPDYLIVEVCSHNFKALFACVYRPPKAGHFQDFEENLSNLVPDYNYSIIAGDVNGHFGSSNPHDVADSRQITRMLDVCGLDLIPYGSTFHLDNDYNSWLDMIASNCDDECIHYDKFAIRGLSARDLLLAVFNFKVPASQPEWKQRRDLKNLDLSKLQDDALSAP